MPNIPVMVGCGASVYTLGSAATEADAETTRSLMSAVGTCDYVSESLFDVVTGLSGSGPAYVSTVIGKINSVIFITGIHILEW